MSESKEVRESPRFQSLMESIGQAPPPTPEWDLHHCPEALIPPSHGSNS